MVFGSSGEDIINFDQRSMFARGGNGSDMYVIDSNVGKREIIIDNNSDDKKLDMLVIPEVPEEFSIQQCNLHLNYSNTHVQVRNYLQGNSYRHLMVMNSKGETFIPYVQSMSCVGSPIENGKLVPFFHATQTQNMFLLPKDFQGDHVVIDSNLEEIEKYKDEDDLLLIREGGNPFIIRIEGFYTDRSKWENISYSLWKNNDLFPSPELLGNVDNIMKYEDKLRDDYERIVKEYIIDFSNSIRIEHNQKLERNISTFVGQDKERIGVMILKDITPSRVEVSSSGADLIFRDKKSNHTINVKNWGNSESYRISTLEFDLGLEPIVIRRLGKFDLSNIAEIQGLINKASEICQRKAVCSTNKELNKEKDRPAQRKRRHHHGDHDRHRSHLSRNLLAIDSSNQPEIAASSGTRPSSLINDLFGWVKSSIGGLLGSRAALPEKTFTQSSISQISAPIDVNGTIMLLDLLIRKVTGQKYISTVDQPISPLKAQGYALNITKVFEKVVEQAGLKSGVSMHRLNIDFVEIQKEVTGKIMSGKFDEISGILNSYVEKACPGKEAGKLSPKKFDKFIAQFNKGLLNQSIEQTLHNRDGTLEVGGAKKQQMSLEPQSYLSNASVQGHSKVSTCLSEIGVTKLGGNINR